MAKPKRPVSKDGANTPPRDTPDTETDKTGTSADTGAPSPTSASDTGDAAKPPSTPEPKAAPAKSPASQAAKGPNTVKSASATSATDQNKSSAAKAVDAAKGPEAKTTDTATPSSSSAKSGTAPGKSAAKEPPKEVTDTTVTAAKVAQMGEAQAEAKRDTTTAAPPSRTGPEDRNTDTAASAPTSSSEAPKRSGGVFWPLVLGGVVAAALGFAASEANLLGFRAEDEDLRATLEEQQGQIDALASAEAPMVDLSGVEGGLADLGDVLTALDERVTALENRPEPEPPAPAVPAGDDEAAAAYAADLKELRAALDRQQSEIANQQDEIRNLLDNAQDVEEATAEAARQAAIQAAVSKITAAISSGSGYAGAIDELNEAEVTELPDPLTAPADEGVPTLSSLQNSFPDAARDALSAARSAGVDGDEPGIATFLRRQLDARSVQPRDGSEPDAVLSRAEAALREGRLTAALDEIDTLPDEAKAAMEGWIAEARTRAEAEAAVHDLSQRLTANEG